MKYDFDILEKASNFTTKAHQGLPRKGTRTPYILHPLEAATIVSSMTNDMDVMAAGIIRLLAMRCGTVSTKKTNPGFSGITNPSLTQSGNCRIILPGKNLII